MQGSVLYGVLVDFSLDITQTSSFLIFFFFTHKHSYILNVVTPHTQCEQGKVIGCGVHIHVCGRKNI